MTKVVVKTDHGGFRLPTEVEYWLLTEKKAYHLFGRNFIEEGNFAKSVVFDKINDDDVDFAGVYDENWGYFNSFLVHLKEERFYGLASRVRSGQNRSDPDFLDAFREFDFDNYKIIEIEEEVNYKIEQTGKGEIVNKIDEVK